MSLTIHVAIGQGEVSGANQRVRGLQASMGRGWGNTVKE